MDIISVALQWAKAEIFSSRFFILVGILFIVGAVGFWQLGRSELARSYIIPSLVCGLLLVTIGAGLIYSNQTRLNSFVDRYNNDKVEFVESELKRTQATISQTERTIFVIIPIMIIVASLLIIFVDKPSWRATAITVIAMLVTLLIVDSNSHSRIVEYNESLKSVTIANKGK